MKDVELFFTKFPEIEYRIRRWHFLLSKCKDMFAPCGREFWDKL